MEKRPLYVYRKVTNAKAIIAWAKKQGFKTTLLPELMHVTVVYSKEPMDWFASGAETWEPEVTIPEGGPRTIEKFNEATVLRFASSSLEWRNENFKNNGASSDFGEYRPHITISYNAGDVDMENMEPYTGKIVLGPEVFDDIDEDFKEGIVEKVSDIIKVDEEQRMVYGWASVISKNDKPVVDIQGDVISANELVSATTEFMKSARTSLQMHKGSKIGTVIHSFPLTNEIAKSMGVTSDQEGWLVAIHVADDVVWKRVKDGTLSAFSIGGSAKRRDI